MRRRSLVIALGLATMAALALSLAHAGQPSPDNDAPFRVCIARLVEQLGCDSFVEREQARKELEAIGPAALAALRDAVKHGDLETSRRAAEIIRSIEERGLHADLLTAKKVHLKVDDVPVLEAVAMLAKLSGYPVRVDGDRTLLVGKKVTVDTGLVTFWEALDKLGAKAGLVEKLTIASLPAEHTVIEDTVPFSPLMLVPAKMATKKKSMKAPPPPLKLTPLPRLAPAFQEKKDDSELVPPPPPDVKPVPPKEVERGGGIAGEAMKDPDSRPNAPTPNPSTKPPVGDNPLPNESAKGATPKSGKMLDPPPGSDTPKPPETSKASEAPKSQVLPGQVILMPGAASKQWVSYAGAARVVLKHPKPAIDGKSVTPPKHHDLVLEAMAEPRVLGFSVVGVPTITRVVDEQGQVLTFLIDPAGPAKKAPSPPLQDILDFFDMPMAPVRPPPRGITLRFQEGQKPAKRLKELSGSLTAEVLVPGTTLAIHDVKSPNKSTDVKGGGRMVLDSIGTNDDTYVILLKFDHVPGLLPGMPGVAAFRGNKLVTLNPALDVLPDLLDAKGNRLIRIAGPSIGQENDAEGQPIRTTMSVTFRREMDQGEPHRLILTGTHTATVVVPFRFADVALP